MDLLLKLQIDNGELVGALEVWYDPANEVLGVWTFASEQDWVQQGSDIPVTFVDGDVLGARATADGQVQVYKNGTLVGTQDVSTWPYYAAGGNIGIWTVSASNALLDDFGGGSLGDSASQQMSQSVNATSLTLGENSTAVRGSEWIPVTQWLKSHPQSIPTENPVPGVGWPLSTGTSLDRFLQSEPSQAEGGSLPSLAFSQPGQQSGVGSLVIDYNYDSLYRLTAADYSDGTYFHYTYDEVGNRVSQTTETNTNTYQYDDANRLIGVDGVAYTWDDNGNLLNDGVNTYTYNSANRLLSVADGSSTTSYVYNGDGDRLRETVNGSTTDFTMDLNAGLTQVLSDGTNTYLYGKGRIAQYGETGPEFFLTDGLGSVRQLVDDSSAVILTKNYQPYGEGLSGAGNGYTSYGFTGEMTDLTGLIYLRARYYAPQSGRFLTKDAWSGEYTRPLSLNGWIYVVGNPV